VQDVERFFKLCDPGECARSLWFLAPGCGVIAEEASVVFLLGLRCFGGGLDHWKLNLEKFPFSLSPLPSLDMLWIRLLVALQLSLMLCLCLIVAVRIW
jgi:hypothetical protein